MNDARRSPKDARCKDVVCSFWRSFWIREEKHVDVAIITICTDVQMGGKDALFGFSHADARVWCSEDRVEAEISKKGECKRRRFASNCWNWRRKRWLVITSQKAKVFTSGNLDTIWIVDRLEAVIAGLKASEHYQRREDSITSLLMLHFAFAPWRRKSISGIHG